MSEPTVEEKPVSSTETAPVAPKVKHPGRQRVLDARGKDVSVDLFLYSCVERERIVRVTEGTGAPDFRWPALDAALAGTVPTEIADVPVEGALRNLGLWYRATYPQLTAAGALDHERMVEILAPIVALNTDLLRMHFVKTGEYATKIPADNPDGHPYWSAALAMLTELFPTYQKYFTRYVRWSQSSEPVEDFVPGSRPPVGRYAPRMPRKDRDGGRGGDRGGRGDRGGPRGSDRGGRGGGDRGGPRSDRGPRDEARGPRPDRPDRGPRPERSERPERAASGDRPERAEGEERGERPERSDRGPRPERGSRGPRRDSRESRGGNDEMTARMTDVALAEVDDAIASMRANPDKAEITLKPQNSFYRRLQHQKIIDMGFDSNSVGEGPERAVRVGRRD